MRDRPRRSALYMPGWNARALEKARGLDADVLIFDLEDAVAPDAKAQARDQIAAALAVGGFGGRELVVRVNALATPWGMDDIARFATSPIDAILLPKVDGVETVRQAAYAMDAAGAPRSRALWCMIETPLGALKVADIAGAHSRLACLVMGTADLAKDLRARPGPDRAALAVALQGCVLAARAHGLAILDGVYLDLNDEAGFAAQCRQGRDWGFDGKTLIHPKTLAAANAAFAPAPDDIAHAQRLIAAHAQAMAEKKGVVVVDGRLVESLHVEEARRVIRLAEAIAARR